MFFLSNRKLVNNELDKNPYIKINFDKLFRNIELKGKKILILGANQGYEAELFLQKKVKFVHGIDIFIPPKMYKSTRFKFILANSEKLPFPDGVFDYVYSQAVLEHVANVEETLLEAVRVLKPGGFSMHIASPLWNSRDGHHRPDIFGDWPWCHVGRTKQEMQDWVMSEPKLEIRHKEIFQVLEEIMDGVSINQFSPKIYEDAVNKLLGIEIVMNEFDSEPVNVSIVPNEVKERLPQNLLLLDLFKVTHTSIVRKLS